MSPRARALIAQVAHDYGLTYDDLTGRDTSRTVTRARFVAMAKVRQLERENGEPVFSYPQIGRMFGRDHSTAINGVRRARSMATEYQLPVDYSTAASSCAITGVM
jgi:chromosomal replication initiation ATPase DnaA